MNGVRKVANIGNCFNLIGSKANPVISRFSTKGLLILMKSCSLANSPYELYICNEMKPL